MLLYMYNIMDKLNTNYLSFSGLLINITNNDLKNNASHLVSCVPNGYDVKSSIEKNMNKNTKQNSDFDDCQELYIPVSPLNRYGYIISVHVACTNLLINKINEIIDRMIFYNKLEYTYRESTEYNTDLIKSIAWSTIYTQNNEDGILNDWNHYDIDLPANILINKLFHNGYILTIFSNKTHPKLVDVNYPYDKSIEVFDINIKFARIRNRDDNTNQ